VIQPYHLATRSYYIQDAAFARTMCKYIFIFIAVTARTFAQQTNDELQKAIADIFTTPNTDFLNEYEVVTTPKSTGFGALDKCGEGKDKGVHMCVPYYNCDGETKTIISSTEYDGTGLIDIRFGSNQCDNYLEVCCQLPAGGVIPPEVTTQPPTETGVTPKEPEIPPPPPIDENKPVYCGIRNPNGIDFKITGNNDNEAEFGEFPWMLAILNRNHDPNSNKALAVCGGSLITPSVVLTGAHCVYNIKQDDIKVRAGEWDTQTQRERYGYQERNVQQIIVHEKFTANNLFNDVALIVLNKPFDKAPHIGTVCLPPQGQVFNARNCFASGWGKDKFGKKGQYQVILKKIQLPTVPYEQCQEALRQTRLGANFKLHDSFICAGGETGKDACTGDGGGPLVCPDPNNPKRYMQAGIVAWGIGCGQANVPGVYSDVSHFRDWIEQNMARLNLDTKPYNV